MKHIIFLPLMLIALSACTREPNQAPQDAKTPSTTQPPAPPVDVIPQPAIDPRFVFDVQVGNELLPDGRLAAAFTEYAPADTLQVVVTLHGKGSGIIRAELQDSTNTILESQTTDISDARGDTYTLTFAPGNARKLGNHRILVLLDEKSVWDKPLTFK